MFKVRQKRKGGNSTLKKRSKKKKKSAIQEGWTEHYGFNHDEDAVPEAKQKEELTGKIKCIHHPTLIPAGFRTEK